MPTLREGDSGPRVREVQQLLTARGYPVEVDGDFGPDTLGAVRAFQAQNLDSHGTPLVVDGAVGPLTYWSLSHPKPDVRPTSAVDYSVMPDLSLGGSALGRATLMAALEEMKVGAAEQGGDNQGPFVRKYLEPAGVPMGSSWCASFVSWCLLQACQNDPSQMPVKYTAGARALLAEFAAKGRSRTQSGYKPVPGDLVFWWRVAANSWQGHVGLVHQVKDGMLYTIEGNRSPRVQGFSYVFSRMTQLLGYASLP